MAYELNKSKKYRYNFDDLLIPDVPKVPTVSSDSYNIAPSATPKRTRQSQTQTSERNGLFFEEDNAPIVADANQEIEGSQIEKIIQDAINQSNQERTNDSFDIRFKALKLPMHNNTKVMWRTVPQNMKEHVLNFFENGRNEQRSDLWFNYYIDLYKKSFGVNADYVQDTILVKYLPFYDKSDNSNNNGSIDLVRDPYRKTYLQTIWDAFDKYHYEGRQLRAKIMNHFKNADEEFSKMFWTEHNMAANNELINKLKIATENAVDFRDVVEHRLSNYGHIGLYLETLLYLMKRSIKYQNEKEYDILKQPYHYFMTTINDAYAAHWDRTFYQLCKKLGKDYINQDWCNEFKKNYANSFRAA